MININRLAYEIASQMISSPSTYNINICSIGGSTVLDLGVKALGGVSAGVELSKICLGGLGDVKLSLRRYGDLMLPVVELYTDHPLKACIASQLAGWKIKVGNFFGMGSGPARILARKPPEIYDYLGYSEDSDLAILAIETNKMPSEDVIEYVSKETEIESSSIYILIASTDSIAGSIQVSARVVETAIYKLYVLGYDIKNIVAGYGLCPISPIYPDPLIMIGKTNDMLLYGGEVVLYIADDDSKIQEYINLVPSSSSKDYGVLITEKIKEIGPEFLYKVDSKLFAPASITVNNLMTGSVFKAGDVNLTLLRKAILYPSK
ncbi:methenyltetrahydromethanopterin cyclohydrolase [Candidatus Geothermarchaeota archaeon]|nr:MAG: methenyltetrahydromethanopterin cyclohydrolase [Candidatus Geothermarchaeota archaeon]HEW93667.1 methenyltetrahydromethanopterin cyclohydrolase [Thermoprotei archaeon]